MPRKLTLAAVGDIALTHIYDELLISNGPDYPFEKVRDILSSHDIVFGNMESPISSKGTTYPLKCSLRANPEYVSGLKTAGFNIVSLSNNHILDYQDKAFYDTIRILNKNDIRCFGAGEHIETARKPAIFESRDVKIGFLGYCDVMIDSPFYAQEAERGIAPLKLDYIIEDMSRLKAQADIIIVSLHWGTENWSYPSPDQIHMAHQIIDHGANLILGHHPHVFQGIEQYKNGYIAYSLGNFIFSDVSWTWTNKWDETVRSVVPLGDNNKKSAILSVAFDKSGISNIQTIPCCLSDKHQPEPAPYHTGLAEQYKKISKRITSDNYDVFWHLYSRLQRYRAKALKLIRIIKKLHKLRLKHLIRLIAY